MYHIFKVLGLGHVLVVAIESHCVYHHKANQLDIYEVCRLSHDYVPLYHSSKILSLLHTT